MISDLIDLALSGKAAMTCRQDETRHPRITSHMTWPCVYRADPATFPKKAFLMTGQRPSAGKKPAHCMTVGSYGRGIDAFGRTKTRERRARPSNASSMTNNYPQGIYDYRNALLLRPGCSFGFEVEGGPKKLRLSMDVAALTGPGRSGTTSLSIRQESKDGRDRKELFKAAYSREMADWHEISLSLPAGEGRSLRLVLEAEGSGSSSGSSAVLALANPLVQGEVKERRPDNLLVILVDTLRADVVGSLGGRHNATPNIDLLARSGVSFSNAFTAATWTRPSVMAMFTGIFPHRFGVITRRFTPSEPDKWSFYFRRPRLLPLVLQAARGYRTYYVGNNFFLGHTPRSGLDHGFQVAQDVRHSIKDSPAITRRAEQIITELSDQPFFLFLHYDSPHHPHAFPAEFAHKIDPKGLWAKDPKMRSYLSAVAYADAQVGKVMARLRAQKLTRRTLVMLLADHGELIFPWHVGRNPILRRFSHGWILYDEVARVPLIMSMPGRIPEGVTVKTVVRTVDLPLTAADMLDVPWPGTADGKSLCGLLRGEAEPPRQALTRSRAGFLLRKEGLVYILFREPVPSDKAPPRSEMLYDTKNDPEQRHNLASSRPKELEEARKELRGLLDSPTKKQGPAGP